MASSVYDELLKMVGGKRVVETGVYKVDEVMIRHWCEAMENANPLYTDEEYAKQEGRYGNIISPPAMVQTWIMPQLWPDGAYEKFYPTRVRTEVELANDPYILVRKKLIDAGYSGTVATNTVMDFFQPLFPGDQVVVEKTFSNISAEKKTSRGLGHFIEFLWTYKNQNGEVLCQQKFGLFMFKAVKDGGSS